MTRLLWKLPEAWRPDPARRASLYPALYLRPLGFETVFRRHAPGHADGFDAAVFTVDGPLGETDLQLLRLCREAGRPVLVSMLRACSEADLEALRAARAVLACPMDDSPLASAPPALDGIPAAVAPGAAARLAEDRLIRERLELKAAPARDGRSRAELLVVADDARAVQAIAPALDQAAGQDVRIWLQGEPEPDELLLALRSCKVLICATPSADALSPLPGVWVRTAFAQGAPAIAASHPSLDGLAPLCVLDDFARGLALYRRDQDRTAAAARAQSVLFPQITPRRVGEAWRAALAKAWDAATRPPSQPSRAPLLMVMFDLGQDLELLLPLVLALRERGVVRTRLVVTDWLRTESPRTLQAMREHELDFELIDRGLARQALAPDLQGVDGVLSASESSAGPHRAAHGLAARAAAKGRPSFTLQHGLENIGLTYRDDRYGPEVRFASDVVFTWGPADALPRWVSPETRARIRPVGSPKRTAPPARRISIAPGSWRRVVGVFENLHWQRFDDDYRGRFLADLVACAASVPDVLFAVKPHHAGRWLTRDPSQFAGAPNVRLLDPADPAWEPFTAPDLMPALDQVITTPSTVAVDAARAGRPVAVAAYGLPLDLYAPLPSLAGAADWSAFLAGDADAQMAQAEQFLARTLLPGCSSHRIAATIEAALARGTAKSAPSMDKFSLTS